MKIHLEDPSGKVQMKDGKLCSACCETGWIGDCPATVTVEFENIVDCNGDPITELNKQFTAAFSPGSGCAYQTTFIYNSLTTYLQFRYNTLTGHISSVSLFGLVTFAYGYAYFINCSDSGTSLNDLNDDDPNECGEPGINICWGGGDPPTIGGQGGTVTFITHSGL